MTQFLDQSGLQTLWNKVKSKFLPLSGGTMSGNIEFVGTAPERIEFSDTESDIQYIVFRGMGGGVSLAITKNGIIAGGIGNDHTCFTTDGGKADINQLISDQLSTISSQLSNYIPTSYFVLDISSHYSVITNVSSFDEGVSWDEVLPNPGDLTFYFAGSSSSNGSKYYPCVKYDNTYTRFKGYLLEELYFGTKYDYVTEVMRSSTDNTESGYIDGVKAKVFKIGNVYFAPNRMDNGESVIRYSSLKDALDGLLGNIFPPSSH